jgi:hypothetical protein
MNNLATVLRNQGKYEQAEEMLRQVLRLREIVLVRVSIHTNEHEQSGVSAEGSGQV